MLRTTAWEINWLFFVWLITSPFNELYAEKDFTRSSPPAPPPENVETVTVRVTVRKSGIGSESEFHVTNGMLAA